MTLAIYGPGGFGRELLEIARQGGKSVCFISDREDEVGRQVLGVDVHSLEHLAADNADISAVIAVADSSARRRLDKNLQMAGVRVGSAIATTAIVGPDVEMAPGAVMCHHTIITASARIGRHFHSNIYSYIAHDCVIGDFVTLAPRVSVNGNTIVEDDVYIGTGAVLKQGRPDKPLRIGRGAVIGMGAVVTKDVPEGVVVVGNPARPLERI